MKRFFSVVGAFIIATGMSCGLFIGVSYADAFDEVDETENSEVDDTERSGIPELTYVGEERYDQAGDVDFYQIIRAVDAEDGELVLSAENTACVLKASDEEVTEDGYQAYELSCTVTDSDGNAGELTHTLYIKSTSADEGETGDDHQGDEGGDENGGDEPGTTDPVQPGGPDNPNEPGDEPGSGDDTPGADDTNPDQPGDNKPDDSGNNNPGDNNPGNDTPGSDDNSDQNQGDQGNQGNQGDQDPSTENPDNSGDGQGDHGDQDGQDNQDTPATPGTTDADQPGNSGSSNNDLPIMLPTTGGDSIFSKIPQPVLYSLIIGFIAASIVYYRTDQTPVSRKQTH